MLRSALGETDIQALHITPNTRYTGIWVPLTHLPTQLSLGRFNLGKSLKAFFCHFQFQAQLAHQTLQLFNPRLLWNSLLVLTILHSFSNTVYLVFTRCPFKGCTTILLLDEPTTYLDLSHQLSTYAISMTNIVWLFP